MDQQDRKNPRGFASLSVERRRELGSKGGRAAHEKGTAFEWNSDEARDAGRKGGRLSRGGRGRLSVLAENSPPLFPEPTEQEQASSVEPGTIKVEVGCANCQVPSTHSGSDGLCYSCTKFRGELRTFDNAGLERLLLRQNWSDSCFGIFCSEYKRRGLHLPQ